MTEGSVEATQWTLMDRLRSPKYLLSAFAVYYFAYFAIQMYIVQNKPHYGYVLVGICEFIKVGLYIFMLMGCYRLYRKEKIRGWLFIAIGAALWIPGQIMIATWTLSRKDVLVSAIDVGAFLILATVFAVIGIVAVGLFGLSRREKMRISLNALSFGSCISFMGIVFISQLNVNGKDINIDNEVVNVASFVIDVMLISFPLAILLYRRMDRNLAALCFGMIVTALADIVYILVSVRDFEYITVMSRLTQVPALFLWCYASAQRSGDPSKQPTVKGENYLTVGVNIVVFITISFAAIKIVEMQTIPHAVSYSFLAMFVIVLVAQLVGHFENKKLQANQDMAIERITISEEKYQELATHDPLTTLSNRTCFIEELEASLEVAGTTQQQIAVIFIDLDRFKEINDTFGHSVGDQVIRRLAKRFSDVIADDGLVARLGGDEFAALISPNAQKDKTFDIASRILKSAIEPLNIAGCDFYLSCSIGIAYSSESSDAEMLLRNADAAMYRAKELGRNRIEFASEAVKPVVQSQGWSLSDLHHAIVNNQIAVYYQPIYDLSSNVIAGFEALARWEHPSLGVIAPDEFISVAEDNGLIIEMGNSVIRQAFAQLEEWNKQTTGSSTDLTLNINLSFRQLSDPKLLTTILNECQKYRIAPCSIVFEMTESSLLGDVRNAIATLNAIQSQGFNLHIDDFGTGYSSLSYLKKFPVSGFKIDKSYIQGFTHDEGDRAIVNALVGLAKSMNLIVTAEGIENPETHNALVDLGCTFGQGYLYSQPVAASEVVLPKNHSTKTPQVSSRKSA